MEQKNTPDMPETPAKVAEGDGKNDVKTGFAEDFMRRIKEVKTTRWIRFGIVLAIFLAWVGWLGSWWVALFGLLLFDIYITGYIPLTWWKKSKSKTTRTVMSWVDAVVYALVLVYFVFAFVGQNYQIPSSSLEKTLLTGDYLWVNKMLYGPRVPMTPIHFPLVHNKFPITGTKSYLETPTLKYKRLKGFRNVEEGDIVVFNFPAGDTVTTKKEETAEYYDELVRLYGREAILADKETYGDIVYRPVDRRQNFVKRAVGLPGKRLKIVDDTIYIDGVARPMPENSQFNYFFATTRPLSEDMVKELGISMSDIASLNGDPQARMNAFAILPQATSESYFYFAPLSEKMLDKMKNEWKILTATAKYNHIRTYLTDAGDNGGVFPFGNSADWTLSDYGGKDGLLIPAKGMTIELTPENWTTYKRCIRNYEGHHEAYFKDGQAYIGGKPAKTYTFGMDYYFMMGDNRDMSQDSRFWGFVPEDHIVGSPMFVLVSFDRERSIFNGGIRWNRILKDANPDK